MNTVEFQGQLICFDKHGNGDETVSTTTLIEVTDLSKEGRIELAFNDRNERCYIKFRLADLMAAMCETHVKSSD